VLDPSPRRLTLLYQLYLAGQASRRFMKLALQGTGMSGEEYAIYSYLTANGPRTLSQAARDLGMPVTSVATLLAPLLKAGMIERRAHPRDGRARLLLLTDAGRASMDRAVPTFSAAYRLVLAQLDRAGTPVETLFDALSSMRAGIDEASDELELAGPTRAISVELKDPTRAAE